MKEEVLHVECTTTESEKGKESPSNIIRKMVHIVAIGLPLLVIWLAKPGSSLFSWHPTLMALSFGFLLVEAILMFSPQSSLLASSPRATKVKLHWILQTMALVSALGGFFAIYYNKILYNKQHFKTWHGCLGMSTVILICLQCLQGVGVLYSKLPLANKLKPRQLKQLHAVCGALVFLVACITLVLGFRSNWFTRNTHEYVQYGSILSALGLAGVVIGQVFTEYGLKRPVGK